MHVDLETLQPNPYRNFTVDPIDEDNVDALVESIKQDGFWGGIVCRRHGEHIEIGAGHHRVQAALKAGITSADLFVGDFSDEAMIRVYARENATQRGNSGTALAGSIASAIKFLAKALLTGRDISLISDMSPRAIESAQGNLASDKGLGEPLITEFLTGVPGLNRRIVTQQLANLKTSGAYAQIIADVKDEIERENKEALLALAKAEQAEKEAVERARKAEEEQRAAAKRAKAAKEEREHAKAEHERQRAEAMAKLAEKREAEAKAALAEFDKLRATRDAATQAAAKSKEQEVTFDFEGVSHYLKNAHQIDVFRECVTAAGVQPYLPVNRQAQLAKKVAESAAAAGVELSGAYIRTIIGGLVMQFFNGKRTWTKAEREALAEVDVRQRWEQVQDDFGRNLRGLMSAGAKMLALVKEHPHRAFLLSWRFEDLVEAKKIIVALSDRFTAMKGQE